jgi:hypothetical protein
MIRLSSHSGCLLRKALRPASLWYLAAIAAVPAHALTISPTFSSSVTGAEQAAIWDAINTIDGLFSNPVTDYVYFNVGPTANAGDLAETQTIASYSVSYNNYETALLLDALNNPSNTVLSTAISYLPDGNDNGGTAQIAASATLLRMLGFNLPTLNVCIPPASSPTCGDFDAIMTLSNTQPLDYDYMNPIPAYIPSNNNIEYDAVGVIEHELDEVLGGGGTGTALNRFPGYYGPLDLYRYSAPSIPSFTTANQVVTFHKATINPPSNPYFTYAPVTSYFSIDGGATGIAGFNQNPAGDLADFGPTFGADLLAYNLSGPPGSSPDSGVNDCVDPSYCSVDPCSDGGLGGPPGVIQDAFSCNNEQREAFISASPEFEMLESIGYDPCITTACSPQVYYCSDCLVLSTVPLNTIPAPATLDLFAASLIGMVAARHRQRARSARALVSESNHFRFCKILINSAKSTARMLRIHSLACRA